jgi:hypothetical protein
MLTVEGAQPQSVEVATRTLVVRVPARTPVIVYRSEKDFARSQSDGRMG